MAKRLTIGELSRRTGVAVKTLRFYSNEGLLPPVERSRSGYRLYVEEHVLRIDLIRALREAGVGLEAIQRVLRRELKLEEVLELRLGAVEAHIASLQRVAAALRVAIRSGATEANLRRISMVTNLSNAERRKVVEGFYAKVMDGYPVANEWVKNMVEASLPDLPDDASAEQLDAWVELATLLEDPSFVANVRAQATELWSKDVDMAAVQKLQGEFTVGAAEMRSRGLASSSDEAMDFVRRFIGKLAAISHQTDEHVAARMRAQYDRRVERYWELVGIMKGQPKPEGTFADWKWFGDAIRHLLETSRLGHPVEP